MGYYSSAIILHVCKYSYPSRLHGLGYNPRIVLRVFDKTNAHSEYGNVHINISHTSWSFLFAQFECLHSTPIEVVSRLYCSAT